MTKPVCTIRILDEVNCVVLGLSKDHLKILKDKYSPYAEGHFFSKKYKMGVWDGKISFFSQGGRTYTRLLEEILPDVYKWGYKINLIDNRPEFKINPPLIEKDYFKPLNEDIQLADHQVNAVNALLSNNGGIVVAATSAGKSYCIAALADVYQKNYDFKILIIVPTVDLVVQCRDDFIETFGLDVGEYSGDKKDINHPIIISTWQALGYNLNNTNKNNSTDTLSIMSMLSPDIIIIDECHLTSGKTLKSILNDYGTGAKIKIGVTGTLPKNDVDAMSVKVSLGNPIYTVTAKELIDIGWLSTPDIQILELEEDFKSDYKQFKIECPDQCNKIKTYSQYLDKIFPDYPSEKSYLNSKKERLEYISGIIQYMRSKEKGNAMVMVNSVALGKKYRELIPNSYFVDGTDKKKARKEIYQLFTDNNDIVVIATQQLISTGLNIPRIFHLFMIDSNKGFIKTIQSIGRGLRKAHDKNSILVIDICSNLKYSKRHKNERVSHYKEAQYPYTIRKVKY